MDANPSLLQFLGFPDKDTLLATNTVTLYVNRDDRERWIALVEREAFVTGFEAQVRRYDGRIIWVRNSARAIRDSEGRVASYEGGIEDITALKESEEGLLESREQLRVLAAHLQSVREEERTRIAREIHDELGQLLTGLKIDLAWLAARLPANADQLLDKIRTMSGMADELIKTVRRIATELRPGILDDLGLIAAIEWQTQEFQTRTGIECDFVADVMRPVEDQDQRTALFRILQETLTNVARHAQATSVVVSLQEEAGCFELRVEDNGRGITDVEIIQGKSLGLLGIQERARLLGGDVQIAGRPGAGTAILVRIPLQDRATPSSVIPPPGSPDLEAV
jgi:PAS domain S-box-containing protein